MQSETISYPTDGLMMNSRLFFESSTEPRPGVLVFPEAFGLGEHAISRAKRLAAMDYVALACDIHGEGRLISDLNEAIDKLQPLYDDTSRMRARAKAALTALSQRGEVDHARVASIGYCFGGTMSL